jgi:FKBP-type peptidyl-prolyl cis-trans isomerase
LIRAAWMLAAAVAVAALFSGCRQLAFDPRPVAMQHGSVKTTSGLRYEEIFIGSGPAAHTGDEVSFEYTVWLEDGTRVDSTYDRGVAITVEIGKAPLPAWNEGLVGIQPEGRRRMVVPPELAYGHEGVEGTIPPDATLVIEVLALDVHRAAISAAH